MTLAAIFDLDGTLIDTPNAIVQMMQDALAQMGRPPVDNDRIRRMIGLPLEQGAAFVLDTREDDPETSELVRLYRRQFQDWMVPQSSRLIYPDVKEGLHRLRGAGISIGLATSKYQSSAEAVLTSAGLLSCFDFVAGADSVTRPKPDAEMALLVATQLGCAPERCVVIGDTVHDLGMGREAGMRTLAVTYGVGTQADLIDASPDWTANSFDAVTAILISQHTKYSEVA